MRVPLASFVFWTSVLHQWQLGALVSGAYAETFCEGESLASRATRSA
jgi:hypothetical protein